MTVCALFQLPVLNVRVAGLTVASPVSPDEMAKTTEELGGAASKTIVNVSDVPDSVTDVSEPVSTIVNPAVSPSVVVTVTVSSETESKLLSELSSTTEIVTEVLIEPSTRSSFTPVRVTVCAVSQFPLVKV